MGGVFKSLEANGQGGARQWWDGGKKYRKGLFTPAERVALLSLHFRRGAWGVKTDSFFIYFFKLNGRGSFRSVSLTSISALVIIAHFRHAAGRYIVFFCLLIFTFSTLVPVHSPHTTLSTPVTSNEFGLFVKYPIIPILLMRCPRKMAFLTIRFCYYCDFTRAF